MNKSQKKLAKAINKQLVKDNYYGGEARPFYLNPDDLDISFAKDKVCCIIRKENIISIAKEGRLEENSNQIRVDEFRLPDDFYGKVERVVYLVKLYTNRLNKTNL